jgi:hypothetical protein
MTRTMLNLALVPKLNMALNSKNECAFRFDLAKTRVQRSNGNVLRSLGGFGDNEFLSGFNG